MLATLAFSVFLPALRKKRKSIRKERSSGDPS